MVAPTGNGQWMDATTFAPDLYPGEIIVGAQWDRTSAPVTFTDTTLTFPAPTMSERARGCILYRTSMRSLAVARV